jgi:hypothetical protein
MLCVLFKKEKKTNNNKKKDNNNPNPNELTLEKY